MYTLQQSINLGQRVVLDSFCYNCFHLLTHVERSTQYNLQRKQNRDCIYLDQTQLYWLNILHLFQMTTVSDSTNQLEICTVVMFQMVKKTIKITVKQHAIAIGITKASPLAGINLLLLSCIFYTKSSDHPLLYTQRFIPLYYAHFYIAHYLQIWGDEASKI